MCSYVLYRIVCVCVLVISRIPMHTCINHLKSRINLHYMCRPVYIYICIYIFISIYMYMYIYMYIYFFNIIYLQHAPLHSVTLHA